MLGCWDSLDPTALQRSNATTYWVIFLDSIEVKMTFNFLAVFICQRLVIATSKTDSKPLDYYYVYRFPPALLASK